MTNPNPSSNPGSSPQCIPGTGRPETAVLYSLFFLTGAALVLPGILLPLLSRPWRTGDGTAGLFFLCFSAGSSLGALLARGRLARALAAGCAMVAAGALLLTTARTGAPLFIIGLYGCGLGLSMTSISLQRSRSRPSTRIPELARLNLVWALGAAAAPVLLLRTATDFNTTLVLRITAALFGLFALLALLLVSSPQQERPDSTPGSWRRSLRAVPPVLLCLIPLATGIESGISSWLSSYIMRGGYVLNVTISATTAFGLGVIASRLLYSHPAASTVSRPVVVRLHALLIALGVVLLILSASPWLSILAALLTGLGVGPMYPFLLALLLNHNEAGNSGFLAGGLGASLLPMLIGTVSGWTHSLRTGLAIPLAAAALMVLLSARLGPPASNAEARTTSSA